MLPEPVILNVPLRTDAQGVIRVGNTRISLALVISEYQQGKSPQELVESYDVLTLKDVYAVLAYYLEHTEELDEYVRQVRAEAERIRKEHEHVFPQEGFKEKLLARLAKKQQEQE
jgi:uncharacterized protein (DUF433 family)